MIDRRSLLAAVPALVTGGAAAAAWPQPLALDGAVAAAEAATGGRVGLTVIDTATGQRFSHRGSESFPMASTFKMLLAAAMLMRVDAGQDRLDRAIPIKPDDIVEHSPFTKTRVGSAATIAELARATVTTSDNGAANLLLGTMAGPEGFTRWVRSIGDRVTRLDRYEVMMSEGRRGDPRDTTSPDAVAASWQRLLLGNTLSPASRTTLTDWLIANTTGDARLRAGLPKGWRVGDKTGTGGDNSVNDVAIVWPPGRPPVIIAAFLNGGTASREAHEKTHADLARAVAAAITR
jgi:beta-lactamase class A